MQNITTKVEGHILYLAIDLSEEHGRTSGGKGVNIAKSIGYRQVPGLADHSFTLHVYRKDRAEAARPMESVS